MNEITKTDIDARWEELGKSMHAIAHGVAEAGKHVAWLLDNDPDAREKFRKAGIPPSFYTSLERVGRGTLLPELVNYTRFHALPVDQQRLIIRGEVTELVEREDGTFDTKRVDVMKAPSDVIQKVIGNKEIRTPEEQRRYLERRKAQKAVAAKAVEMPWTVSRNGGKLVIEFTRPCIMTRADMLTALKALEV